MKNLVKLKIELEELRELKETENLSEESYNIELRRLYNNFKRLKKKSLEDELYTEVKEIIIEPLSPLPYQQS